MVELPRYGNSKIIKYSIFIFIKIKELKTIVFDLDETLIHCNENVETQSDITISITFPNQEIVEVLIK